MLVGSSSLSLLTPDDAVVIAARKAVEQKLDDMIACGESYLRAKFNTVMKHEIGDGFILDTNSTIEATQQLGIEAKLLAPLMDWNYVRSMVKITEFASTDTFDLKLRKIEQWEKEEKIWVKRRYDRSTLVDKKVPNNSLHNLTPYRSYTRDLVNLFIALEMNLMRAWHQLFVHLQKQ